MKISSVLASAVAALFLTTSAPAFAKMHMPACKGQTVYAVASTMTYYMKGSSAYGHVKGGKWMCEAAARSKGYKKARGTM